MVIYGDGLVQESCMYGIELEKRKTAVNGSQGQQPPVQYI